MYYCCWPCVCDTKDFMRVDSKTLRIKDGSGGIVDKKFWFSVIANPCDEEEKLSEMFYQPFGRGKTSIIESAPEVRCEINSEKIKGDKNLANATLSDGGYPILAMFFDSIEVTNENEEKFRCNKENSNVPGRMTEDWRNDGTFQSECEYYDMCKDRALGGYNSGMGEIFRKVAQIGQYKKTEKCPDEENYTGIGIDQNKL